MHNNSHLFLANNLNDISALAYILKTLKLLIVLSVIAFSVAPLNAYAYRVLFVGNSFTGSATSTLNAFLQASPHEQDYFQYQWVGSYDLVSHFTRPETLSAIRNGTFDYVVLQDHSVQPIYYRDDFNEGIDSLVKEVRQSGAEPILFMTWARKVTGNYAGEQSTVISAYLEEAQKHDVKVIKVGEGWNYIYQNYRTVFNQLYILDDIHSSSVGAFLIASSVYKVLYPDDGQAWTPTQSAGSSAGILRATALQFNQTNSNDTPSNDTPKFPVAAIMLLLND